jgi:hypothetical protein
VDGELRVGAVSLRRSKYPGEPADAQDIELLVRYYPAEVNWDLKRLVREALSAEQSPHQRRANKGRPRRKRS